MNRRGWRGVLAVLASADIEWGPCAPDETWEKVDRLVRSRILRRWFDWFRERS